MDTWSVERPSTSGSVAPTTVFRYKRHHPLNAIFEPRSVAVIGATEKPGSVGRTLLWNLVSNPFGGADVHLYRSQGDTWTLASRYCGT